MVKIHIFTILICFLLPRTNGHGRLIEPPSRASAWRYGFDTPHNYNDHELFCGGYTRQWVQNEGKCGVCGDPWDSKPPRLHEYGGTYGQGVIVRNYSIGSVITIRIELTASHMGFFEFALCPNYKNTTQECLNKNILTLMKAQDNTDKATSKYYPKEGNKVYEMRYRLPKMACAHCVLQWRYVAGNNWGNCGNGTETVGCGPQEEFRSCADISIGGRGPPYVPELPEDTDITTPSTIPEPEESYSPISAIIITVVTFLVISLLLFLLYFHYYQVGKKIMVWFKSAPNKDTVTSNETKVNNIDGALTPPVAPPRAKRNRSISDGNMHEIDLKRDLP